MGLVALVVVAPVVTGLVRTTDLVWGAGAGLGAAVGVSLLYHGLAVGVMSMVAPVTAVGSACIPVLFGLVTGDRPPTAALVGVMVALAAVALLAIFPGDEDDARPGAKRAGVVMGLVSGAGFGTYFVLLDHASGGTGLWPLVGSLGTSVAVLGTVVLLAASPSRPPGWAETWA